MSDVAGGFCAECGTALPGGAGFCPSCGTAAGSAAPAPMDPPPVPPSAPPTAPVPPPPAPPPPAPAAPGTPPPTTPAGGGGRRGVLVAVVAVVALLVGAVVVAGGGDDGDDAAVRDPDDPSGPSDPGDGPDGPDAPTVDVGADDPGSWTVMVYVIGDTDLEPAALVDLEEMAEVGSDEDLSIVALVDRAEGYTDDRVLGERDWESAKTFEIGRGELVELDDHGEQNLGDPQVLSDFIASSVESHPADHYALVLWDHGAGWIGMGPDDSHGDLLELPEIAAGIEDGVERAGLPGLDLVGFDACAMATYEVAEAMSGSAAYLLASEELEPGHGWDYAVLADVADGRSDARDVGRALLDGYLAQAELYEQDDQVTLSLVDLRKLDPLRDALADLAAEVDTDPAAVAASFGIQRHQTNSFGRDPNPEYDLNLADLGAFVRGIGALEPGLETRADAVAEALDDAVVAQVTGPAARSASGLSVYFPEFPEFAHPAYGPVAGGTAWGAILDLYLGAGQAIPVDRQPQFLNPGREAEWFFDEDGLNVFGTFDLAAEDNLVEAIIYYGIPDRSDGSIIFYGEEPGEILRDGSGTAGAIFDLTVLQLSDGEDDAFAYLDLSVDEEAGVAIFDVPLVYQAPDSDVLEDVVLSVVLDLETEEFTETYYLFQDGGSVGELDADPTGLIFPVVLNQWPDGSLDWIPTSDIGLWAELENITYEFVPYFTGEEIYAELTVFDYGGNSDFVVVEDVIP